MIKLNKNLKNLISLLSIEFIARFIAFLSVTYLARVLGTSNFGVINIGLAVLGYAMIVANGGLSLLGTKKIAAQKNNIEKLTGDIFLTKIQFSIVLFIISVVVTYLFVSYEETRNVITIYLLFLFPSAILLDWFFHGRQNMEVIAAGRVTGMIVYFVFLLLFVTQSNDTVLAGFGWVIGGIVNSFFLLFILYKKKFSIIFNFKNFNFIPLIKESFPLGLASIIGQFVVMFPVIYLGIVYSTSESGIFSAAYKLIILLLVFERIFNALFFPKIVQFYQTNRDIPGLNEIFNKILKIISFVGLSISLLAVISGKFLITKIFGVSFFDSIIIFQILVGSMFLTMLNSVFTFTLIAMNKEKIYTLALLAGMLVFIISIPVFTNYFNAAGSALSLVLFEFICLLIMYGKLKNNFNIIIIRNIILPAVLTFALFIPSIVYLNMQFYFKIVLGISGIVIIALITGLGKNEFEFIKKRFI